MPTLPTTCREDGAPSNWDRYLGLLAQRGVPETMRRLGVDGVQRFLSHLVVERSLAAKTPNLAWAISEKPHPPGGAEL